MFKKISNQSYYTNRHSCFLLQYHMVLVTKYRHPVITGSLEDSLYGRIKDIFEERGLNMLEMNGEKDYVHILFEADSMTSPGELANVIKTQSSRTIRKMYGDNLLKKWYWKPCFWSESYFVCTVSENSLSMVQEYIKNQKVA